MKLLIFGPPGAGKGTLSAYLQKHYGIAHISTGDLLRKEIAEGTEIGKKVKELVAKGQLVPDDIVFELVKKAVEEVGNDNFVLDGFPRTVEQAKMLDSYVSIDAVIVVNLPDEIIIKKVLGRRVCPKCGAIYNVANVDEVIDGVHYYLPAMMPKEDMVCDHCGTKLVKREDDTEETIKKRLKVYKEWSKPVIAHYRGKVPFVEVLMNRPASEVVKKVVEELNKLTS